MSRDADNTVIVLIFRGMGLSHI